jgi:hypothetical protein
VTPWQKLWKIASAVAGRLPCGVRAKRFGFQLRELERCMKRPFPTGPKLVAQNLETDGSMRLGGRTTLLGVKICAANRLPASYFVSISYMCWAYRRQGVMLDAAGKIGKWLY